MVTELVPAPLIPAPPLSGCHALPELGADPNRAVASHLEKAGPAVTSDGAGTLEHADGVLRALIPLPPDALLSDPRL